MLAAPRSVDNKILASTPHQIVRRAVLAAGITAAAACCALALRAPFLAASPSLAPLRRMMHAAAAANPPPGSGPARAYGSGSGSAGAPAGASSSPTDPPPPPHQHQQQRHQQHAALRPLPPAPGPERLVRYLTASHLVKTPRVEAALRAVDRARFVPPGARAEAYRDHPLPIGYGQTISAPHMHAVCLELLEGHLVPGARVLDVGSGSGYLSAVMALLVAPNGSVLAVEKVPELAAASARDAAVAVPGLLPEGCSAREGRPEGGRAGGPAAPLLEIVHGNVLGHALDGQAPFDAIHVGAAADELHALLVALLAPGGRIVIPVGPRYATQALTVVDRGLDGRVGRPREVMSVGYVPLTRPSEMEDGWQ